MNRDLPRPLALVMVVTLGAFSVAWARTPKFDAIFPAGGTSGETVNCKVMGGFERWPVKVWCDRPDVKVEASAEKETLTVTIPPDAPSGLAWLRIHDEAGASSQRRFVIGTLPEIKETEPNDALDSAGAIELPVTVNGQFQAGGDFDLYRMKLSAGQTLVASLEAHRRLGSACDGVLQLLDERGFILQQVDDERSLDPAIVYRAARDGTFFIRCFAFPALPDSTINTAGGVTFVYRLSVTTGPYVDQPWPIAVSRIAPATLGVMGWNLGDGLSLPCAPEPDGDLPERFLALPRGIAGEARVTLEPHPVVEATKAARSASAQSIAAPVTLVGRLEAPLASDQFSFEAQPGEAFQIRASVVESASALDPVVIIRDSAGKVVSRADDVGTSPDAELKFIAPAAGVFRLTISDLFDRGGERYVYRLSFTRPVPDYSLSVVADVFSFVVGQPLEIPVTIERREGFAGEIEVAIAGLPEGLTATPMKSLAADASGKLVKLTVNAAAPGSGPLRIVGRAETLQRSARGPAPGAGEVTRDLWISAVKAP